MIQVRKMLATDQQATFSVDILAAVDVVFV